MRVCEFVWGVSISIHALLAESDHGFLYGLPKEHLFLSTLSLRRATGVMATPITPTYISIHALLAESDLETICCWRCNGYFYPRSPCGERLQTSKLCDLLLTFLSTLSLRRATEYCSVAWLDYSISIHALLAESDILLTIFIFCSMIFLSTLSLRRATKIPVK